MYTRKRTESQIVTWLQFIREETASPKFVAHICFDDLPESVRSRRILNTTLYKDLKGQ